MNTPDHSRCWLKVLAVVAMLLSGFPRGSLAEERTFRPMYPETKKCDQVDDYHGESIADPYRWLEEADAEDTKAWVVAQNKVTESYLSQLPQRDKFRERLTELWNFERFGTPRQKGGRYFYTRNDGLQNQSVLCVAESLHAEPRVLLDPNQWSKDGTVDLASWIPSDDGKLLAIGVSHAGSDWTEWKVVDVDTGKERSDLLKWVKFSGVAWTPDNSGLYYSRYAEPAPGEELTGANYNQQLYFHRLGESQSSDTLIYERPDQKEWGFQGGVTEDGRYLLIHVWRGTERKSQIFYQDLQEKGPIVELLTGFDADYDYLGNDGKTFYIQTDHSAPRGRVVAIDLDHPEVDAWKEIIPQTEDTLESADLVGDLFFARYLKNACSVVERFHLDGSSAGQVELPGIGSANGFHGERADKETFYSFTNFTTPSSIYRYDLTTGETTLYRAPKVAFDGSDFETKQVFVTSADGVQVPMFIVHKKGLKLDGSHPTMLYGYGGFNISITPGFSLTAAVWLETGGVYAVANIRGGGEFGQAWHEGGTVENKQHVFDDFIAAAEWLQANKYTSAEHLAIRGGSNGGLLVGACMTQRPELFAACAPAVGVLDMLRFHKFTIGWAWISEYGSADDAAQYKILKAYSPLHCLKPGTRYPATLVTTGDHDDRVVPAHSFKYAAALQAAQAADGPPTLIRIETSAGHGGGKPTSKVIEESADVLAFLWSVVK
ncbi:prolyl oligopeptidase family serine peptidase [Lignipirellula cremea]|uniref:prolyl oligopeptidase n=1 Tax=Lignipirellula cremea TaxID=2528010 RepID=A0A518E159_9BACT|nr:prolyl oligopeptidase family serine peptidase [Lignipirellula cremea]QDU97825.1 Prolyl endopeptidase precursor [Lignipirellula cremea]